MSRLAIITFITPQGADIDNTLPGGPVYPGQGLPGGPVYPSHGLPTPPVYPGHGLPGGGDITTLPVFPFDPTKPVDPDEGEVDNTLPTPIRPGARFIVKYLACVGLILVPDNSLPSAPARPSHGLPPTAEPKK